jgi:heme/copper-type cytochrome/quinol oxidase subunit 2/plastocyanin
MRPAVVALVATVLLLLAAAPAAARFGMPEPLTDRGRIVEDIYAQVAIAGILVFVLVFVLLVWVLARYRESTGKGRATHEKHRGSLAAELSWTLIPLAIVLWVGYISYVGLVQLDLGEEGTEPEMAVTVTGYQWAWEMDYGGGVKVFVNPSADAKGVVSFTDTFRLPANVPIRLNVTGGDVIHAFNIMDENRAYFAMDDANPSGPHKVHSQTLTFPAGKYLIQCKEMCLNPGHGYMRAELVVEPKAQFDRWLEERTLAVGADLTKTVQVTADSDSLDADGGPRITIVTGTRVILVLANTASEELQVRLPNGQNVSVPSGQSRLAAFDTGVEGDFTLVGSNGGRLVFNSVQAEVRTIDLGNFVLDPDHLDLEAGKTYLFQVRNVHSTAHNVYIGDRGTQNLATSATIAGGETTSFVWTATAGEYDMWCDVPGHVSLGMIGTVRVA